jgi:type IV pilus assembly protein PilM
MAKPARIISLDLGSQSIGLADFRVQPQGGIVLQDYLRRQVLAEPSGEAMREPQMAEVLREMLDELQIRSGNVNYSITGQSVFVRFLKLPPVDEEKIQRIISFEAQQGVPCPIDDVVWDYHLIGGGCDEQLQIVLVAIKADLLEAINRVVEESGLKTSIVDAAPMARYNAFRFSYGDLSGCSLLVNIGAHTTNLLFVEPESFFSRTIPIGGASITATVAKEFDEPFTAAEFRKERGGFVRLERSDAGPKDADAVQVSKIARNVMTRLHAELMRSISHYRVQQNGNLPERIFLGGGGANMPYVREFFQEKTELPTEFFNPLRQIAVAECAAVKEITRGAHLLGELVGLALRSVSDCPIELNLRSATVVRRQELEKRRAFFVMAVAALILSLLGWGFYYARAAQVTRVSAEKIRKINEPMHAAEAKIDKLRKEVASLDAVGAPLATAINDRFFWVEILEDLNARLPKEDIWITELIPTSVGRAIGVDEQHAAEVALTPTLTRSAIKGQPISEAIDGVLLRGLYLFNPKQQEVVADYFRNLVDSPFFNVDPNNQARAIKSTIPNNTDLAFSYELRLDLKKPMRLP